LLPPTCVGARRLILRNRKYTSMDIQHNTAELLPELPRSQAAIASRSAQRTVTACCMCRCRLSMVSKLASKDKHAGCSTHNTPRQCQDYALRHATQRISNRARSVCWKAAGINLCSESIHRGRLASKSCDAGRSVLDFCSPPSASPHYVNKRGAVTDVGTKPFGPVACTLAFSGSRRASG